MVGELGRLFGAQDERGEQPSDFVRGECYQFLIAVIACGAVLAEMARGRLRAKNTALIEALTGRFDDHHAELAAMLLDQIDVLTAKIDRLTLRIEELLAQMPAAGVPTDGPDDRPGTPNPATAPLPVLDRLDEIPGIGRRAAQIIVAEIGLDMSRFPTSAHLVSWAKLCPATIQSGTKTNTGKIGKGNPYLKGVLGEVATAAAKTQTFLGERYRRLVKRMGKLKALVAIARSILVIIWHLLNDPAQRYLDLGVDHHTRRIDIGRKSRDHIRHSKPSASKSPSNPPPEPRSTPTR